MYKHILIPIAYDADHDGSKAIAVARQLAGDDARFSLLHVMEEVPGYAINYMPEGYSRDLQEAILGETQKKAEGLINAEAHVAHGHAGRTILEWADRNGVDCIVVSSHRPGVADFFLGSTASRIVRHAHCSVHVLR